MHHPDLVSIDVNANCQVGNEPGWQMDLHSHRKGDNPCCTAVGNKGNADCEGPDILQVEVLAPTDAQG